ncbi:Putative ribosomal N-acetyltransferase YdaF [Anatilimnocola aggregata]|uniref:Ribosomal N-acetyltransferase YdaF n=1 Tax=Anatilimnocola aggregata TaxID=2528021 RepID=A0A517YAS1_9BACT|nr:GNAT family N-acetyltransferase [Anatilimnocola aggregata]QDU27330.1 Putative ribosomal N-acetyltransferase YdaF [Anatilimnocola aggregata]
MNQATLSQLPDEPAPILPAVQPTLRSKRLRLRPFDISDARVVQLLAGDKEVAHNTRLIPHPYPDGLAEAWITSLPAIYEAGKGVSFAITLPAGDVIGSIGLMINSVDNHAEMGYWVGRPYWNHGYCTEAAQAVLKYAFDKLKLERVFANYLARNPASGRVLSKLGMTQEGCFRSHRFKHGQYEDLIVCGVLRKEFAAKKS